MLVLLVAVLVALVATLVLQGRRIMADLTRITAEVSEISTVADSAVALLAQLAELIRQNATDPAALNALADQLDTKGNELAAAVAANTPGAEPPPSEG